MDNLKIRIRQGNREIEVEGGREAVELHLEKLRPFLGAVGPQAGTSPPGAPLDAFHRSPDREGLSLRQKPSRGPQAEQLANGLLELLYGYRTLFSKTDVLAPRLAEDLRHSGYADLTRLSRAFARLRADGYAIRVGKGKGTRYRLTEPGIDAAQRLIRQPL